MSAMDNMPHVPNLCPSVESALQTQASDILTTYLNGNKSTARAMLNQVQEGRQLYVSMWVQIHAQQQAQMQAAYRLICSVTE